MLPIWVWLLFTTFIIGVVTLIYSEGNWRTTFSFVGLAMLVSIFIISYDTFQAYLHAHFIGKFNEFGNPVHKSGPGWTILSDAWPLWFIPFCVVSLLVLGIVWLFRSHFKNTHPSIEQKEDIIGPLKNIGKELEFESLKQELENTKEKLAAAISSAEAQIDKNLELEITASRFEEEKQKTMQELQDKITTLELDSRDKRAKTEELTSLILQQAEEITRLKNQH